MNKIRIRTLGGKMIECEAEIIDKDNEGRQYSIAIHAGHVYEVVERDSYGAIFSARELMSVSDAGRKGGSSKSPAKIAASRANGAKNKPAKA